MELVRRRIKEEIARRNETNPSIGSSVTLAIGLVQWEPQMKASLEQIIGQADSKVYSNKRKTSEEQSY